MHPVPEGSREPVVKILDLGLACWKWSADSEPSISLLTQEGMVIGTVDYIAPEQAKDSHLVDIRGDLYSLGCTFYYLLAGRPPFPDGTTVPERPWYPIGSHFQFGGRSAASGRKIAPTFRACCSEE